MLLALPKDKAGPGALAMHAPGLEGTHGQADQAEVSDSLSHGGSCVVETGVVGG